ncbi:MAG: PAS domain S-box protein [Ignavibacteriae bacterium]|nr:PAS domain S-box protein [Ignavibacteriota bacterium]
MHVIASEGYIISSTTDFIIMARENQKQKTNYKQGVMPPELLNLLPSLVIVLTPDGTIVEANRYATEVLKLTKDNLLDRIFYDFCVAEERARMKNLVEACFDSCEAHPTQTKLSIGDGMTIDVDLSLISYPSRRRVRRRYCVLIGRDISEEKKKELDLLRFSNIAHYTVNPVEITDPDGKIIYVNPAFERASGYSKEELLGKNPNIFGSGKHPKSFWKKMWDTIKSGKVWVGEIENRRRTGEPIFTHLLISPIIDNEGTIVGYFGVHRDITNQKYLEQQLIHAQKMESIGMLAAGLAHEVGNPLTSISSLVQVIQRTTQDEFTQEKLELIKSQIIRISRIIRDLVDFSRRSSYEVQLTDVNKSLQEAIEIVRVGKKAKGISFHVDTDDNIPKLPLVPDQIEQVFINILINAVDAIDANKHLNKPENMRPGEIRVRSTVNEENVVITIQDNGKGISEDMLPKIFEPFFTTKKVGEGTGLGLWVSYGIIKSFQGTIQVKSHEGLETTFTITLPLHSDLK